MSIPRRRLLLALVPLLAVGTGPACDGPGGGGGSGLPSAGGATGEGGRQPPSVVMYDPSQPVAPQPLLEGQACLLWNDVWPKLGEGTWEGSVETCEAGTWTDDGHIAVLSAVNLYRKYAGLPPVLLDEAFSAYAQECALTMHANLSLSHDPPTDWACYSEDAWFGAQHSNLATAPGLAAIGLYMIDTGNQDTIGHRRWILSRRLSAIGSGSTSEFSCLFVIDPSFEKHPGPDWVAWPPPGEVPVQALEGWGTVDEVGWTVQSPDVDLSGAIVTVTSGSDVLPVQTFVLPGGFGSTFAIRIWPEGWKSEVGETYHVSVKGTEVPIEYDVTPVDCAPPPAEPEAAPP